MRQAGGRHEQAEQEEDRHLGHLGEGVKEVRQLDLAGDVACAQHNAGQVHGQKAVAAQVARQRVGDDCRGEQKDGLRALGCCACAFNQVARRPADGKAQAHAQDNLLGQQCGNVDVAAGCECGEHGGEHVGDGVVGARFDLEQRVGAAPQRKAVLAQNAKDAGRVGGRHNRSQQQAADPVEAQYKVREHAGNAGSDDDAERAQQHRRRGDGLGTVDVGVKTAVEHDEQQRRAADGFGERVVAKVDVSRPVDAQQHAERDKDEQGGEGEFFADGLDGQAQNNNEADKEKDLVHGWCPLLGGWRGTVSCLRLFVPKDGGFMGLDCGRVQYRHRRLPSLPLLGNPFQLYCNGVQWVTFKFNLKF